MTEPAQPLCTYPGCTACAETYYFDPLAADRAVAFFPEVLVHVKGEKAGQALELDGWQAERIIRPLFGCRRRDEGTRRYRQCYIEIPRKNGKSTLGAGIGLYLLAADDEAGAEVYSAASDRDQAAIVFEVAKQMRNRSTWLRKRVRSFKRTLVYYEGASSYTVISADADTKHGYNAHGIVFDELHAQPNRKLYDVLTTSTGARRQPLVLFLTTAGWDRHSVCWEVHDYAEKVLAGILHDPTFLPVIYAAAKDDPWDDVATWRKANPGLGTSVKLEYLEQQAKKARASLAYQNTFRRLHLNQWTEQAERAIDMDRWNLCTGGPVRLEELRGRPCFGGLDLAISTDIAALVLVFPDEGGFLVYPEFFVPADNVAPRVLKDRVPYDTWITQGLLTPTPGSVIDYDVIRARIKVLSEQVEIREMGYDRWGAVQLAAQLEGDGLTMVAISQGFPGMAAATKAFLAAVTGGTLQHGGHPILRWMASNFSVVQNSQGDFRPDKGSSGEKIDGIVATIMALDRATRQPDFGSKYEREGLLVL